MDSVFSLFVAGRLDAQFICLPAGAIERYCCFATILLLYAPPKVVSVLVLFVIFGGSF